MSIITNIKRTVTILVGISILIACEKKLDFDGSVTESKLVINEDFSPSSNFVIHVSNSLSVIDAAELRAIENAEVKIYQGEDLIETLEHTFDGYYQGPEFTTPQMDVEYTVEVNAPGFNAATAKSVAPSSQLEVLNIDTTFFDSEFNEQQSLRLDITIRDNDPDENFYGIAADGSYLNSGGATYIRKLYLNSSDIIFGASNGESFYSDEFVFEDALLNQTEYVLTVNIENIYDDYYYDEVTGTWIMGEGTPENLYLNIFTYSKDLYLFNKSSENYYDSDGDPFSQPTQVYTNVDGGFGIFGGFSKHQVIFEF